MFTALKIIYGFSVFLVFILYFLLIVSANIEFNKKYPLLSQFSKDYPYTNWAETIVGLLQLFVFGVFPAMNTYIALILVCKWSEMRDDAVDKAARNIRKRLIEYAKEHTNEILDEYKEEIDKGKWDFTGNIDFSKWFGYR